MTDRPAHFVPKEGQFLPQKYANSHWGDDHLNGPAIVGLAAHTLERQHGSPEFIPTRLTVDLFTAARNVPTEVRTKLVRDGRRVRNAECDVVQGGTTVAHYTGSDGLGWTRNVSDHQDAVP
jgi:hypothetical protein